MGNNITIPNENILLDLDGLPFDGEVLNGTRRGAGPRREYIAHRLEGAGLYVAEDGYGNLWAAKGGKGQPRVYSSHMDVDAMLYRKGQKMAKASRVEQDKNGNPVPCYRGVLDNAVGCYLNIMLAMSRESNGPSLHIFTASEEEDPDTKVFNRSARDAAKVLKEKGIKPELCVALDASYPKFTIDPDYAEKNWDNLTREEVFDANDKTYCYLDGISDETAQKYGEQVIKAYNDPNVKVGTLPDWDEAVTYNEILQVPSFAVGPVAYTKYQAPDEEMPVAHVKTALDFVKYIDSVRMDKVAM